MPRTTIRCNKALAEALGVHPNTVSRWRNEGRLDKAVIADTGRVIIYDLEAVYECLSTTPRDAPQTKLKQPPQQNQTP